MILLMNTILLPTMHTNAGEGEDGGAEQRHEERTKELEIGKGVMYAMLFCGRYAPCGATKQFDQTFPKFDAWCESMEGRRDEEERAPRRGAI